MRETTVRACVTIPKTLWPGAQKKAKQVAGGNFSFYVSSLIQRDTSIESAGKKKKAA